MAKNVERKPANTLGELQREILLTARARRRHLERTLHFRAALLAVAITLCALGAVMIVVRSPAHGVPLLVAGVALATASTRLEPPADR